MKCNSSLFHGILGSLLSSPVHRYGVNLTTVSENLYVEAFRDERSPLGSPIGGAKMAAALKNFPRKDVCRIDDFRYEPTPVNPGPGILYLVYCNLISL